MSNFTDLQYIVFEFLVRDLRSQGYSLADENILPLTHADYYHGRHVAPCHNFDWIRVKKAFPGLKIHGSWKHAAFEERQKWFQSVQAHHDALGSEKMDLRSPFD